MIHRRLLVALLLLASLLVAQPAGVTTRAAPRPPRWTVAGENAATDWLVYATPSWLPAIVPDGDRIWAASDAGLLCWDRNTGDVTQYLAPQTPLPSNHLVDMLLYDGNLYISTRGAVAVFDRHEQWTVYRKGDLGLPEQPGEVTSFGRMVMVDGVLWVDAKQALAQLYPDGRWELVRPGPRTFPAPSVSRFEVREDGVYVGYPAPRAGEPSRIVARFVGGRWEPYEGTFPEYAVAPDGSWWKASDRIILRSTDLGTTWQQAYEGQFVSVRAFDAASHAYVSDDAALLVLEADGRVVERYAFSEVGPELRYVNIIQRGPDGRMWIATDGRGLTMYDGREWHNWQPENSDLRDDCIRGLAVTERYLYAGVFSGAGAGGVSVLDLASDEWLNLWPGESPLSGGGVGGIAVDTQGRAYFPTAEGILDIYDNGEWQHRPMSPMPEHVILSTKDGLFDAAGHYWLAASGLGLWEYDGSSWRVHSAARGELPSDGVTALALDPVGRLWAATAGGLAVRDVNGAWGAYDPCSPSDEGMCWLSDVAVDAEGRIWVERNQAVAVFDGRQWQQFAPGLVGETLWGDAIGFDATGRPWVALSSNGIAIYRGQLALAPLTELRLRPTQLPAARGRTILVYAAAGLGLCSLTFFVSVAVLVIALHRRSSRKGAASAGAGPELPADTRGA